jgi:hypothetical protein
MSARIAMLYVIFATHAACEPPDRHRPRARQAAAHPPGQRAEAASRILRVGPEGVDIVADLNEPLDLLPENCAEHVFSSHALEHVDKLLPLLAEIHRITRHNPAAEVRYKMRVCKS